MLGENWRKLFKYIIVSAKKPKFFHSSSPFRLYDERLDTLSYAKINELEPGRIYAGVSFYFIIFLSL